MLSKKEAKVKVEDTAKKLGGSVASTSFRTHGNYARGFIAVYCSNRNISEIRVYPDGNVLTLDQTGRIVH
jgi:hypothetical protein